MGMRLTTTEVQYLKMKLPYLCLDMTERPKKHTLFWPSSWCSLFCFTQLALSLSQDSFNLSLHHNYIIMFFSLSTIILHRSPVMCARGQKQGLVQITQLLELPFVYQIRFFNPTQSNPAMLIYFNFSRYENLQNLKTITKLWVLENCCIFWQL